MKKILILFLLLVFTMFAGDYENLTNAADFKLKVSRGKVISVSNIDKFGVNRNINTIDDPQDVWSYGGLYTFSPVITLEKDNDGNIINFLGDANITKIVSSSATDSQDIIVYGLDENGYISTQIITLNGQTPVTLNVPLWRVYRALNNSDGNNVTGNSDTNLTGTVYITTEDATFTLGVPNESSEVRAIIEAGNQTLMAVYTIPRGKVGYLFKGIVGIDRAQSTGVAVFQYLSRRVGKNLTVAFEGSVSAGGNSYFKDERSFPDVIPELTDIVIRVTEVSDNNMGAFAAFDILLEDM